MKWKSAAIVVALLCSAAYGQDVTADEMVTLDKLRAEFEAKGVKVTPEMEARMLQRIRAINALNQGNLGAGVAPAARPATAPAINSQQPLVTELALKEALAGLSPATPITASQMLKDGLIVDGQRFADPEGRATRFTVDAQNGHVAYLVEAGTLGVATFKIARADRPQEAVTVGTLRRQGNQFQFSSVTGKTLNGELFFPLTDGVLLMRDSVGFRYVAGGGTQQINVPSGWAPTPIQRGNLSTTGWMLLERDQAEEKASPFAALTGLGKLIGGSAVNDYALMNLATGKLVEIDISSEGKNTHSYSQCRKKNAVLNQCDKMTTYESAYKADGSPNLSHYLWKIDWQRASSGPIMVSTEGRMSGRVCGVDLDSGKKVLLFERTLGVTLVDVRVKPDGKMAVAVAMGLSRESMDDIGAEISARPAVAPASAQR